jgi:O-antigen/teichoic acid export membrane protein
VSILRQLGANSAIYAATNLLQRGAAFMLMPLYTLYLDPSAYGVLAIVTAVNGLLSIAFTLGLTSAMTRFYFEYQDDPQALAQFWGSILVFVVLLSAVLGGVLLWSGDVLLRPLIGDVPFWPYVALGVMATFFQPFFATFLATLQMRNHAGRYAAVSLANFGLTTLLTVALVVWMGWGVRGPLVATLVASGVFFVVSLWMMRGHLQICLHWRHLKPALGYSLPLVPHSISGQATAFSDRLVLNSYLGTASAGLYSVGAMVALVVEVTAQSVNRAYVPLTMAALKRGQPEDLAKIHTVGTLVVALFSLLGAAIAAFSKELLWLMASPAFGAAASVIPILVFAGVANAIYFLFVNVLFYDRNAVKLIPVGTLSAAAASVLLSLLMVPRYGLMGAAWSALLAQTIATVLIAAIAYRLDPVRWNYGRYAVAFGVALSAAVGFGAIDTGHLATDVVSKAAGLVTLAIVIGVLLWNRPLIFGRAIVQLLKRRPEAAAALFTEGRALA